MNDWTIHYFDPQLGREVESRHMLSLEEAVSAAEAFVRQGCAVQFIASPDGKMNWPLSQRCAAVQTRGALSSKLSAWHTEQMGPHDFQGEWRSSSCDGVGRRFGSALQGRRRTERTT
jgi:hypothetical protein